MRIPGAVGMGVVNTVNAGPPNNRSLQCHRSERSENDSNGTRGQEGTMREMPVKTHFDADKREDIHNRARCQGSRCGAVSPRETSGGQNSKKRKYNDRDRHQVGAGADRPMVLSKGPHLVGAAAACAAGLSLA